MKVKQNVPGQIPPPVSMGMKSSLPGTNCSASLHFVLCAKASARYNLSMVLSVN